MSKDDMDYEELTNKIIKKYCNPPEVSVISREWSITVAGSTMVPDMTLISPGTLTIAQADGTTTLTIRTDTETGEIFERSIELANIRVLGCILKSLKGTGDTIQFGSELVLKHCIFQIEAPKAHVIQITEKNYDRVVECVSIQG